MVTRRCSRSTSLRTDALHRGCRVRDGAWESAARATAGGGRQGDETVLVLGSGGGCAGAAVGCLRLGARVIAGASTRKNAPSGTTLGAHYIIDYATEKLCDRVMDFTHGAGVDVVFDLFGGTLFDEARRCVGRKGRYLVIGFAAGDIPVTPAIRRPQINGVIGVAGGCPQSKTRP